MSDGDRFGDGQTRVVVTVHDYLGMETDPVSRDGRVRCSCGWAGYVRPPADGRSFWELHREGELWF